MVVVCDFKQRTLSTSAHGATGAFITGRSTTYISNLTTIFSKIYAMFMISSMFAMVPTITNIVTNFRLT